MNLTRRTWLVQAGSTLISAFGVSRAFATQTSCGELCFVGGPAFGSYWRATIPARANVTAVRHTIEGIIRFVDRSMSPFRADSEISRFNAQSSGGLTAVSQPFRSVVGESLRVAGLTEGAFDPTVGPLVNRLGFGPIRGDVSASFADISVQAGSIKKANPNATLDLCGIAKGYALDEVGSALQRLGIRDFVVEIGGEAVAVGRHPEGRHWRIAIEAPIPKGSAVRRVVRLDRMAIATSGDTVNGYAFSGKRYSHIVRKPGASLDHDRLASVSVLAPRAIEADALATAIMALGLQAGTAFSCEHDIPTLMLLRGEDGFREESLSGFLDHVAL